MIDVGTLQLELQQARKARLEAQASACDIETLLDTVKGSPRAWYRLAFGREAAKPDLFSAR
ncbi:hypothetical protein PQJ75_25705 [Rhodoplanes sp. TEM]|uniref:Uncharacterized protein n=1 Tax=Rhodoplanes tepidamans TaxID=200616 RepID=A0ABT5JEG4_RHOTP|nr:MULTISPECIES: hypothetical protein [Rhodoplanes]MDC7787883.1 hypothetical protein [Rhodoplanes tepidamans]MDC7987142.1 hypothetical protein [Rhodoplanes sp. TEM]MDQ0353726.1 hypothetical protein [Rhodoplanes tepidamans]